MPEPWISTLARIAASCIAAAALACTLFPAETLADDGQPPAAAPAKKARLDLSLGDVRRYLDPVEMATPLPDELEEIIVRGRRPPPLPEQRVIPAGLGAFFYAIDNPLQTWRILVPDPNVTIPPRDADDVRDPPGSFRGRILAPGRIYD
jgi:hypothetical protein